MKKLTEITETQRVALQGTTGEQGPVGPMGPQGMEGRKGDVGAEGLQGDQGSQGSTGELGPEGEAPEHKWRGNSLQFQKADGTWGTLVDLTGPQGSSNTRAGGGGQTSTDSTGGSLDASTGHFEGGIISVNGDDTKFNVSAGSGRIVDNYTDPANPTMTMVTWTAFTAVVPTYLLTNPRSFLAIDINGDLIQSVTDFTNTQAKDYIVLGSLGHANLTSVVATLSLPIAAYDAAARLADFAKAIGPLNINGNIFSPASTDLTLDKSSGKSYRLGSNRDMSAKDVDVTTDLSISTSSFIYAYRDDSGGWNLGTTTSDVDPANYDDGSGTLQSVSNNQWSIQVLKYWAHIDAPEVRIEYGQTTYISKQSALDALPDPDAIANPAFFDGIVRCYIVVRGGGTDLSDTGDAEFVEAAKFGASGGGQFTSATTDLQQAYDNSTTPEIITDSTAGALTVKEGTSVGGNLYEGRDDADALMFSVSIAGITSTKKLIVEDTTVNIATQATPASAGATGAKGDIVHDTGYIYVCTATDTWKRTAIATW